MSNSPAASKTVVIRASRDTLGLLAAASAMTFAMSYAVHSKRERVPPLVTETQQPMPRQDWAGHLAELAPQTATAPSEPMSSATLVVPKAQLALPALPVRLPVRRPCLDATCASKGPVAIGATAAARRAAAAAERTQDKANKTLFGMLNPLNHLPDVATVGRPFTYAGSTVASWFKRL